MNPEIEPLKNVDWLAETLGISKPTVYRFRSDGKEHLLPPCVMVGNQPRWQASTVAAWLAEQEAKSRIEAQQREAYLADLNEDGNAHA